MSYAAYFARDNFMLEKSILSEDVYKFWIKKPNLLIFKKNLDSKERRKKKKQYEKRKENRERIRKC